MQNKKMFSFVGLLPLAIIQQLHSSMELEMVHKTRHSSMALSSPATQHTLIHPYPNPK